MIFAICFSLLWLPIRILFPTKVIGKKNLPKKQGYVLTCNHYSNLDPVLIDIYLNKKIRFLAKKELFKNKFGGYFLKRFGAYPVNRERPEVSAVKFSINTLKSDKVLGVFPEGTRNKDEKNTQLLELKNGAIVFASKAETVIVPMVLYKKARVFRKNYLIIGEPIEIEGEDKKRLTHEEAELNTQRLADAINKLRVDMDKTMEEKKNKKRRKKNE